jgi:hypothetical protein
MKSSSQLEVLRSSGISTVPLTSRRTDRIHKFAGSERVNNLATTIEEVETKTKAQQVNDDELSDKSALNWYYQFSDQHTYNEFRHFIRERGISKFFLLCLLVVTISLWPITVSGLHKLGNLDNTSSYSKIRKDIAIALVVAKFLVVTLTMLVGWAIVLCHFPKHLRRVLDTYARCWLRTSPQSSISMCVSTPDPGSNRWKSQRMTELSRQRSKSQHGTSTRVAPLPAYHATFPVTNMNAPHSQRQLSKKNVVLRTFESAARYCHRLLFETGTSRIGFKNAVLFLNPWFFSLFQCMLLLFYLNQTYVLGCGDRTFSFHTELGTPENPPSFTMCDNPNLFSLITSLVLLIFPFLLLVALPDVSIIFVWCTLTGTIVSIVPTIYYLGASRSWYLCFLIFFSSCFLVIDHQLHKVQLFMTSMKLREILVEKERTAEEMHVSEMRHMIANVAHDLKTVSICLFCEITTRVILLFGCICSLCHRL